MMAPQRRTLPFSVRRRLLLLRWAIRGYVLLEAVAVAAIWLGVTFWSALALDYLPVLAGAGEMPRGVRAALLVAIGAVFAWVLYRWLLARATVRLRNEQLAVLLERRFPEFGDALVTVVELAAHPDHAEPFNETMLEQTSREALHKLPRIRLHQVFRLRPLVVKLATASLLALSLAAFWQAKADAFELWVRRMYLLDNRPWPRQTHIEVLGVEVVRDELSPILVPRGVIAFRDGRVKVAKGATVKLLVAADAAKKIPQRCVVHYRTDEGDRGQVVMKRIGQVRDGVQRFEFDGKPFRGLLTNLQFDVRGGDHRVRGYHIDVVDAPAIVATELHCVFPDYLVDEATSTWMPRTMKLTSGLQLPMGTRIEIRMRANKPLSRVELLIPNDELQQDWSRHTIDVRGSSKQALEVTLPPQTLDEQLVLDVVLQDRDGVSSDQPHHIVITGVADEAPRVQVTLRGIGTAITPQARLPFSGTIRDDYRVDRQWLEIVRNKEKTVEVPFALQDGEKVDAEVDFRDLQKAATPLTLKPKDKLMVTVRAADRYNLKGAPPNVGNGDRFQLDVVTADELLAMLDRRELGLRRRFEQIIDEMTLMRDSLARIVTDRPDAAADLPREPGEDPDEIPLEQRKARLQSLNVLRAQRALSQVDKSAQEIVGVAASFDDIRLEIENNRIDAADRQERLKDQISEPLQLIAASLFPQLKNQVETLQSELESGDRAENAALAARQQADDILIELDKVLQKMLELEDYNALVQLVRRLLEEQKQLVERTKALRKKKAFDLLR